MARPETAGPGDREEAGAGDPLDTGRRGQSWALPRGQRCQGAQRRLGPKGLGGQPPAHRKMGAGQRAGGPADPLKRLCSGQGERRAGAGGWREGVRVGVKPCPASDGLLGAPPLTENPGQRWERPPLPALHLQTPHPLPPPLPGLRLPSGVEGRRPPGRGLSHAFLPSPASAHLEVTACSVRPRTDAWLHACAHTTHTHVHADSHSHTQEPRTGLQLGQERGQCSGLPDPPSCCVTPAGRLASLGRAALG